MSSATACAHAVVDELVRCGVRDAVLSPGSRSAPLAFALHAADAERRLRLHVRIDERTAGFLALGLAKASRCPVPVVTTSGTAVANLHPALLEASHAGVPVVALTADRPATLRGTGANQTTDQVRVFGGTVRSYEELSPAGAQAWRATVCRALATAVGLRTADPGPVHVNAAFDQPLVPDHDEAEAPAGRPAGAPWTRVEPLTGAAPLTLAPGPRTVVVAGDQSGPDARRLAESGGWPLLAEPSSGARTGRHALRAYRLLLDDERLGKQVERAVVYGHPTVSRHVTALLSRRDVEVVAVSPTGRWTDVGHRVSQVVGAARVEGGSADDGWLRAWREADSRACAAVDAVLADEPALTPYAVARIVWESIPSHGLLVVGSSNPIRDIDLVSWPYEVGGHRLVLANRGLAGIDGTVSTAVGAALARPSSRAVALIGDLTLLHDSTGLLLGPDEPCPDLTIVVVNDDGGGIFSLLEQGAPDHSQSFERLFGTPLRADLRALCAASATPYARADHPGALRATLDEATTGLRVLECPVDRVGRRDLERRIREAAAAALR